MNYILFSRFVRDNKCNTTIENPSDRVMAVMTNISSGISSNAEQTIWNFTHRDIGTIEEMNTLFACLEACK